MEFYCETGLPPDSREAEEEIKTYDLLKKRRKEGKHYTGLFSLYLQAFFTTYFYQFYKS